MKIGVGFGLESTNKGADHRRTPKKGGSPLGLMPIAHRQTALVTPDLYDRTMDAASRRAVLELQSSRGLAAAPCTRALCLINRSAVVTPLAPTIPTLPTIPVASALLLWQKLLEALSAAVGVASASSCWKHTHMILRAGYIFQMAVHKLHRQASHM